MPSVSKPHSVLLSDLLYGMRFNGPLYVEMYEQAKSLEEQKESGR
jgi:hypothetical protein